MLRSANRYRALDETAVFGYCCRHEFPGKYINLKHGERYVYICNEWSETCNSGVIFIQLLCHINRLAYAVWMLENILQSYSQHLNLTCLLCMTSLVLYSAI